MRSFARANDAIIMRSIAGMRNAILRKNLQCVSSCYKLVLFGQSKLEANSWDSFLTQGRFPRFSPVECTLYAGLLLFPAVAVFAKLSTNHGWLLFPRFSPAGLFTTGYTYFILPRFPVHVVVTSNERLLQISLFSEAICSRIEQLYDYFRVSLRDHYKFL